MKDIHTLKWLLILGAITLGTGCGSIIPASYKIPTSIAIVSPQATKQELVLWNQGINIIEDSWKDRLYSMDGSMLIVSVDLVTDDLSNQKNNQVRSKFSKSSYDLLVIDGVEQRNKLKEAGIWGKHVVTVCDGEDLAPDFNEIVIKPDKEQLAKAMPFAGKNFKETRSIIATQTALNEELIRKMEGIISFNGIYWVSEKDNKNVQLKEFIAKSTPDETLWILGGGQYSHRLETILKSNDDYFANKQLIGIDFFHLLPPTLHKAVTEIRSYDGVLKMEELNGTWNSSKGLGRKNLLWGKMFRNLSSPRTELIHDIVYGYIGNNGNHYYKEQMKYTDALIKAQNDFAIQKEIYTPDSKETFPIVAYPKYTYSIKGPSIFDSKIAQPTDNPSVGILRPIITPNSTDYDRGIAENCIRNSTIKRVNPTH